MNPEYFSRVFEDDDFSQKFSEKKLTRAFLYCVDSFKMLNCPLKNLTPYLVFYVFGVVNCDFEVMVAFCTIVFLDCKALILQPSSGFADFSTAIWTMDHKDSIKIGLNRHKSLMNLE